MDWSRRGREMRWEGQNHSKDFGRRRATECFVRNKDRWELASVLGEPLWLCGGAGQAKGGKVDAVAIIQLRNEGGWMTWGRRTGDLF